MAYATKRFNGASYDVRGEYVLVEQIEKDIANNRSKLKVTYCVYGSSSSASLFQHYQVDIDVAGQNVFDYPFTPWYGNGTPDNFQRTFPACEGTVSKEIWVNHDTYGNCTINVYFYTGIFSTNTQGNYGSNMTLDSIPRASTATMPGKVVLGTEAEIYIERSANVFTHTIKYAIGNETGTIATEVADRVSWTPPIDLAYQITNSPFSACTITCETYNGQTYIGSYTWQINLIVPHDLIPSVIVDFSEADTTMINNNWGIYVKDRSKLAVTLTATESYHSIIRSYSSNIQGITYNSSSYISNILSNAGDSNVTAQVTDNRGSNSLIFTKQLTVVDYFKPRINSVTVARCTIDGMEINDGEYLIFSFNGEIAQVENKNAKTFRIGYRIKNSNDDYTWLVVSTDYTVSYDRVILTDSSGNKQQLAIDKHYDIRFEAIDSFETTFIDREIGTGFDLININASGNSMAIGQMSTANPDEKKLEIALDTKYKGLPLLEYEIISTLE